MSKQIIQVNNKTYHSPTWNLTKWLKQRNLNYVKLVRTNQITNQDRKCLLNNKRLSKTLKQKLANLTNINYNQWSKWDSIYHQANDILNHQNNEKLINSNELLYNFRTLSVKSHVPINTVKKLLKMYNIKPAKIGKYGSQYYDQQYVNQLHSWYNRQNQILRTQINGYLPNQTAKLLKIPNTTLYRWINQNKVEYSYIKSINTKYFTQEQFDKIKIQKSYYTNNSNYVTLKELKSKTQCEVAVIKAILIRKKIKKYRNIGSNITYYPKSTIQIIKNYHKEHNKLKFTLNMTPNCKIPYEYANHYSLEDMGAKLNCNANMIRSWVENKEIPYLLNEAHDLFFTDKELTEIKKRYKNPPFKPYYTIKQMQKEFNILSKNIRAIMNALDIRGTKVLGLLQKIYTQTQHDEIKNMMEFKNKKANTDHYSTKNTINLGKGNEFVYLYYFESSYQPQNEFPCKIGMSKTDAKQRIIQQCETASLEYPKIALIIRTKNGYKLESLIHLKLRLKGKHLDTPGKEWYQTTPQQIIKLYKELKQTHKTI